MLRCAFAESDVLVCCAIFCLQALAWVYDKELVRALFEGAAGELGRTYLML